MKKTFGLLFSFISLLAFSQMQTYKFENVVSYRIKDDFYSNFLNILSTSDYSTNIFIVATPMGNIATLNINDRYYVVYSDDRKVFKIDVGETFYRNKYKNNDDPSLDLTDYENDFILKKTNEQETIKSKQCNVYSITSKDSSKNNDETICIDTTSRLNTVPFIIPAIKNSVKGLVYRIGNKIELNYSGTIENLRKEEEDQDEQYEETTKKHELSNSKQKNFIIEFDEKAEIENYKKEYNKKNKGL